jgi:hypothetical protein
VTYQRIFDYDRTFDSSGASGRWFVGDVLAGRSLGTEGAGLDGSSGLVVLVALLDQKSDTAVLAGNETNSLFLQR